MKFEVAWLSRFDSAENLIFVQKIKRIEKNLFAVKRVQKAFKYIRYGPCTFEPFEPKRDLGKLIFNI